MDGHGVDIEWTRDGHNKEIGWDGHKWVVHGLGHGMDTERDMGWTRDGTREETRDTGWTYVHPIPCASRAHLVSHPPSHVPTIP